MLGPRATVFKLEQPLNALIPNSSTRGNSKEVKLLQSMNASLPIEVICSKLISLRDVQLAKACPFISFTLAGRMIVCKFSQPMNSP